MSGCSRIRPRDSKHLQFLILTLTMRDCLSYCSILVIGHSWSLAEAILQRLCWPFLSSSRKNEEDKTLLRCRNGGIYEWGKRRYRQLISGCWSWQRGALQEIWKNTRCCSYLWSYTFLPIVKIFSGMFWKLSFALLVVHMNGIFFTQML